MDYILDYTGDLSLDAVKASGVKGIARYLTGPNALGRAYVDQAHALGLGVILIFETASDEAEHPERGAGDATVAEAAALTLGAPLDVPIFYTDDHNDNDTSQEIAYVAGILTTATRPQFGFYSGFEVIEALFKTYPGKMGYGWQVETWAPQARDGSNITSSLACLRQLANSHPVHVDGVPDGSTDVNEILLASFGAWLPQGTSMQTEEGDDMGYWLRHPTNNQVAYVTEFRMDGYDANSVVLPPSGVVKASQVEWDTAIQKTAENVAALAKGGTVVTSNSTGLTEAQVDARVKLLLEAAHITT